MILIFFKLCIGHAVADFWAQSEGMRKAKGWKNRVHSDGLLVWPYALSAHAAIHAGAVWLITGLWWLAAFEFVVHWLIDFGKCSGFFNAHVDQAAHIGCKALWAVLV